MCVFFFQAEDGIRDLVRSRGLGDVYKRQVGDSVARGLSGPLSRGLNRPVMVENLPGTGGMALSLIHI